MRNLLQRFTASVIMCLVTLALFVHQTASAKLRTDIENIVSGDFGELYVTEARETSPDSIKSPLKVYVFRYGEVRKPLGITPNPYGNGNITEYVDDNQAIVAHYEYGPFGKVLHSSGSKAGDFRYQFSTKPLDTITGLHYYGYRWYDSSQGRWINRDPIKEDGGLNVYDAFGGDPINRIDVLGENWIKITALVAKKLGAKGVSAAGRRLYQIHHVLTRQTFRKFGKELIELGFKEDGWLNVIVLPSTSCAKLGLKGTRSMHRNFSFTHMLYNRKQLYVVGKAIKKAKKAGWDVGSQTIARNTIKTHRAAMTKGLHSGSIDVFTRKAAYTIGAGIFMVSGVIVVEAGSDFHKHQCAVAKYEQAHSDWLEAKEIMMKYSGGNLTFEKMYGSNAYSFTADLVNPFTYVDLGIQLGSLPNMPSQPVPSKEVQRAMNELILQQHLGEYLQELLKDKGIDDITDIGEFDLPPDVYVSIRSDLEIADKKHRSHSKEVKTVKELCKGE